jgi:hypothetical protein
VQVKLKPGETGKRSFEMSHGWSAIQELPGPLSSSGNREGGWFCHIGMFSRASFWGHSGTALGPPLPFPHKFQLLLNLSQSTWGILDVGLSHSSPNPPPPPEHRRLPRATVCWMTALCHTTMQTLRLVYSVYSFEAGAFHRNTHRWAGNRIWC